MNVSDSIRYIGVYDDTIDLFEGQYPVPQGISYNSYLILDEKVALMDTVDQRATAKWLDNLQEALGGRTIDYLIVSHMEPDHAGSLFKIAELYPEMTIVGNAKTFPMISQFFPIDLTGRTLVVKEGDTLSLGRHTLTFTMAPMVHWPEVMMTYESEEKIVFSADAFGRFGDPESGEEWTPEARRYFINIVGKYGAQVQAVLKKVGGLDVRTICPLHGPVLQDNLGFYIGLYDTWSSYRSEEKGVLIAYASIHGHTAEAAAYLADQLKAKGETVELINLGRADLSEAVAQAFRFDRMVLACSTYDGGIFTPMDAFLHRLRAKSYQNRTVYLVENGTWAPMAAKQMRAALEEMKNISVAEPVVTIRSAMNDAVKESLNHLI